MRVRFPETLSLQDLRRQVDALVDDLAGLGVEEVARVNIYFEMRRDGHPLVVRTTDGTEVGIIEVGRRTRAFAEVGVGGFATGRPKVAK